MKTAHSILRLSVLVLLIGYMLTVGMNLKIEVRPNHSNHVDTKKEYYQSNAATVIHEQKYASIASTKGGVIQEQINKAKATYMLETLIHQMD